MKLKKRMLSLAVTAMMMVGFIAGAAASSGIIKITAEINPKINYILNGKKFVPRDMDGSEMNTIIYNGRSYVPLRAIAEALNVYVDWDAETSTIILGENNAYEELEKEFNGEITLLHFNNDEASKLAESFMKKYQGIKVNIICIADINGAYQSHLASGFNSGSLDADIIAFESAFVKKFVNITNSLEDLSSPPYNAEALNEKLVPYTIDVGRSSDGKIRALSHHSYPTGIGYKRDLAKTYLETNQPEEISRMFASSEKILETAKKLKEKSSGKVKLFPNLEELLRIYLGSRSSGWIKNGELFIDPKIDEFMELAKKLQSEGLVGNFEPWTPQWANAINDNEHFAWAIATWGVPWIIDVNMSEGQRNSGNWGIALPEVPSFWGGTWFGIYSGSSKKNLAWEFLKYITTDTAYSKYWATTYGDFSSNMEAISQLAEDSNFISPVINQNLYSLYQPELSKINGKIITEFDDIINNIFIKYALYPYANGEVSKDKAIQNFKEAVYSNIGTLNAKDIQFR
ncbi:extracellular solute-binding protein [Acetivibrio clariflavus]|uniref:extracellular solute-binding protein n=1 Tax=Acetivibrio clariflavus TaxID=288965 RepID=UPI0031F54996